MNDMEYLRASDGLGEPAVATVIAERVAGDTTLKVSSTQHFPAKFIASSGMLDQDGYLMSNTLYSFYGQKVDETTIKIVKTVNGYIDTGNSTNQKVVIKPTSEWANQFADIWGKNFEKDGSLKYREDLKGQKGDRGTDGVDGKTAYQQAVDNGFIGTEKEWVSSLKGERGEKGDGIKEITSESGVLIIRLDTDEVQTFQIPTVKGEKGDTGERGATGANGADGKDGKDGVSIVEVKANNDSTITVRTSDNKSTTVKIPTVAGVNGKEVEMRVRFGNIQWRYNATGESWNNLIEIAELKGKEYDDTALKSRISAVETGKADKTHTHTYNEIQGAPNVQALVNEGGAKLGVVRTVPTEAETGLINGIGVNRLAFFPAEQITVETSTNNGATWSPATEATPNAVKQLVADNDPQSYSLGFNKNQWVRITLDVLKPGTNVAERYAQLDRLHLKTSTAGSNAQIMVEGATRGTPDNFAVISPFRDNFSNWPSPVIIKHSAIPFGGAVNQTTNYRKLRITIKIVSNINTIKWGLYTLSWYGNNLYTAPANNPMARSGAMYNWDIDKNVSFPGRVSGSSPVNSTDFATKEYADGKIQELKDSTPFNLLTDVIKSIKPIYGLVRGRVGSSAQVVGANTVSDVFWDSHRKREQNIKFLGEALSNAWEIPEDGIYTIVASVECVDAPNPWGIFIQRHNKSISKWEAISARVMAAYENTGRGVVVSTSTILQKGDLVNCRATVFNNSSRIGEYETDWNANTMTGAYFSIVRVSPLDDPFENYLNSLPQQ